MSGSSNRQKLIAQYPYCYACDLRKTSREHVPPLCFFPDEKDENGLSKYRKNLIRVPSCDAHNAEKSDDDFYAAFHLASTIHGNHCAELVRDGAIARELEKDHRERGSRFSKLVLGQVKGTVGENVYGELNPKRMVRFLELCARGLYFYEMGERLKRYLRVANVDFDLPDQLERDRHERMRDSFNEEMRGTEFKGDNPDAFRYAICQKPEKGLIMIEMVFFGTLQRWAYYWPDITTQDF